MKVKSFSHVWLFAAPWTVAYHASPSMGFSRQEYWSGLPFPSSRDLPDQRIKPRSPALEADALTSEPPGKPVRKRKGVIKQFEGAAYLVFQTSSKVANKICRLIALKFSVLHRFATQIVIHLDSEDGSCCAFILSTLLPWKSRWQKRICQLRNSIKAECLIRKHAETIFELYCVDHNKLWKILKEMGIPDHLTCLLRNLYAGQEATVRTGHGTTVWFQIGKGVRQGCILSPCLFNFHAEYIMRNAGLEEAQAGIKIAGRNTNNF